MKKFYLFMIMAAFLAACEKADQPTPDPDPEDIVFTKTVQLPIVLEPHTCVYPSVDTLHWVWKFPYTEEYEYITTRNDGIVDRDFSDQINRATGCTGMLAEYEYVSVKGTSIKVSGGELVKINTYATGENDTIIISKPTFKTSTEYKFVRTNYVEDNTMKFLEDTPERSPKCSFDNNTWIINEVGYGRYYDISHKLMAINQKDTTSITVNQNNNYGIGKKPLTLKFLEHELVTQRDYWPDFEDYPVGCTNPKWPKDECGDWASMEDTKNLHPDGNRYIEFYFPIHFERWGGGYTYLSGQMPDYRISIDYLHWPNYDKYYHINSNLIFRGGIKITATADVKLKDGSTKTVTHTSEWLQPENPGEMNNIRYNGRGEMICYTIYLPVVENAAEDFHWHLKFELTFTEKNWSYGCNLKDNSNFFDYDWYFPEFTFKDCLYTVKEYEDAKRISGIYGTHPCYEQYQGDIIDGVEQYY